MNIFEEQKKYEEAMKSMNQDVCNDILKYITDEILQQKNNAIAIEFAKVICDLLKQNGVYIKFTQIKSDHEITKNYIEEKYNIFFDGADFSEHDKEFKDEIEKLKEELQRSRNTINQIDDILDKLFGMKHDVVETPDEFEKILRNRLDGETSGKAIPKGKTMILRPFKRIRELEDMTYAMKSELALYREKEERRKEKEKENSHSPDMSCEGCENFIKSSYGFYCKLDSKCGDRREKNE